MEFEIVATKALVLLAAREGAVDDAVAAATESLPGAVVMRRLADDAFAQQYPGRRAFDVVAEIVADTSADLVATVDGLGAALAGTVHTDLSGVLVGDVRRVVGDGHGPVRFLYLMRHKVDVDHLRYRAHWAGHHAEFGRTTPGILGYDQFHVDPVASQAASAASGLAVWRVDGVAELHLNSLEEFFSAAVGSSTGNAALEDEKSFVDGANSVGFTVEVLT
jgi:EthD domain